MENIEMLPINTIFPDTNQPRKYKSPLHITGLAQNFLQDGVGIINPIEVDDTGMIVTGEMRWLAAKEAGFTEVPVKRFTPKSPELRYLRQVSENVQQSGGLSYDMSPMDTARSFKRLCEMALRHELPAAVYTVNVKQVRHTGPGADKGRETVSRLLGLSHVTLWSYLALLRPEETPTVLQEALETGIVSSSVARSVRVAPKEQRHQLAERVVSEVKKGTIKVESVRRVAEVLRRDPAPSNPVEVIECIVAGDHTTQTIEKLSHVAPTHSQYRAELTASFHELEERARSVTATIRAMGSADTQVKGLQSNAYGIVSELRDTCDTFLAASNPDLAPIDVEAEEVEQPKATGDNHHYPEPIEAAFTVK